MHDLDLTAIGNRIKEQREYLGYTRENMSELISKSVNCIRNIETGATGMSLQTLASISKALNISADYILFGRELNNDERLGQIVASFEGRDREFFDSFVKEFARTYSSHKK